MPVNQLNTQQQTRQKPIRKAAKRNQLPRNVIDGIPELAPEGLVLFEKMVKKASVILEYGAGGSTIFAARFSNIKTIISSEPDQAFLQSLVSLFDDDMKRKIKPVYIDIGPVRERGYPLDPNSVLNWHKVPLRPWRVAARHNLTPDLVFIDGRFRVACFLASLLSAKPGTSILFDDYGVRPEYHIVEKFVRPQIMQERLTLFHVPDDFDKTEVAFYLAAHINQRL